MKENAGYVILKQFVLFPNSLAYCLIISCIISASNPHSRIYTSVPPSSIIS